MWCFEAKVQYPYFALAFLNAMRWSMAMSFYSYDFTTVDGKAYKMRQHVGDVLLIVNTASGCGFTPQYQGLQDLHSSYQDRGFSVLAFPCNQFGGQEPGDNGEIASFCQSRFSVTFPVFQKLEVNGSGAHPFFSELKNDAPGILGTKAIKWNFTKFLVDKKGRVVSRYGPRVLPVKLAKRIELLIEATP